MISFWQGFVKSSGRLPFEANKAGITLMKKDSIGVRVV